jgi:hypothetical protein
MISAAKAYRMLGNETLWDVAMQCHTLLEQAKIAHAVLGGVAVCLHGYQRNTVDLDLLIGPNDAAATRTALEQAGFKWSARKAEFVSSSGVPVHFLTAGERAGKSSSVLLPDPADKRAVTYVDGLPVLALAKVIETKIACAEGNLRRTHKDFADVVELIAVNRLSKTFAARLHKSLRPTFRKLVEHARG